MRTSRPLLLVAVIAIGVGVYLLATNLGRGPQEPAQKAVAPPRPERGTQAERAEGDITKTPEEDLPVGTEEEWTCVIGGIILDARSGPVVDAQLFLLDGVSAKAALASASTDGSGRFRFEPVSRKTWHLVIKRTGESPPWYVGRIDPSVKTPAQLASLEFKLGRQAVVVVHAMNREYDSLADIAVSLLLDVGHAVDFLDYAAPLACTLKTDATGRLMFNGVQQGDYALVAHKAGLGTLVREIWPYPEQERPFELFLEPAGRITGVALTPEGEPAVGATITSSATWLTRMRRYPHGHWGMARTRTGPDGTFELGALESGGYVLAASLPGYATGHLAGVRLQPGETRRGLTVRLEPPATISGRVRDEEGRPLGGVPVVLRRRVEKLVVEVSDTVSAADGGFEFQDAPAHGAILAAQRDGYHPEEFGGVVAGKPITIILTRRPVVTGVVTNAETGQPIKGATVFCLSSQREAKTDENGRYELAGLTTGRNSFVAFADGLGSPHVSTVEVSDNGTASLDFALTPAMPIMGVVVDQQTGEPIEGAGIQLAARGTEPRAGCSFHNWSRNMPGTLSATADEGGNFMIPVSPPELPELRACAQGCMIGSLDLGQVKPGVPVRIELRHGAFIVGHVLAPDGRPLEDATVGAHAFAGGVHTFATFASAVTDESGAFCLSGLEPNEYWLTAYHREYVGAAFGSVKLRQGQVVGDIEITLAEGGRISGIVTSDSGEPLGDSSAGFSPVEASATFPWSSFSNVAPIKPDGSYISALFLPGKYEVRVSTEDFIEPKPQIVEVLAGVTLPHVDFTVLQGATVSGRVVDEAGNPVPGARVQHVGYGHREAVAKEGGIFAFRGLKPGRFEYFTRAEGYLASKGKATAPTAGLEIVLRRGGGILGQVVDKETLEPVEVFGAWISEVAFGEREQVYHPAGRFEMTGLPEGECTLVVRARDYAPYEVDISIEEDAEPEEVIVELSRGTTLVFQVASAADGRPVQNVRVSLGQVHPSLSWHQESVLSIDDMRAMVPPALTITTDTKGACMVEHVPAGEHRFPVEHAEFAAKDVVVTVVEGESRKEVEVLLSKGFTIRGRVVTSAGQLPVRDAYVMLTRGIGGYRYLNATSDDTGSFVLKNIVPGDYVLLVEHPDYAPARRPWTPDSADSELTIELSPGMQIAGTVTTSAGTPIKGATIRYENEDYKHDGKTTTDEQGRYAITHLAAALYQVRASREDPPAIGEAGELRQVMLEEGQDERLDVVLGGATVYGVVTLNGKRAEGVSVLLRPGEKIGRASCRERV